MESRKRWPEKSAGRAWAKWVEALIFLDLLVTFRSSLHYLKIAVNIQEKLCFS
jgi:hypothetical protein